MSRYLNTRTPIPWKALGQRKIWSDPILIETKLPGTFVQRKDDPRLWQPILRNPLFYLLLDTKTTSLATVIWKIIAAVLTSTPGHSLNRRAHLCPGLPWKMEVPTIFRTSQFSVTSLLFFSLTRRGFKIQQIVRKLRKLGAATICRILRFFVTFLLFLYLPDGTSEFNKFWENCEKSWSQLFAALYDFSSLLCCSQSIGEGFRFQLIPRKVREIVPHFTIFLYTSSSLRRKADVKLIALVSH